MTIAVETIHENHPLIRAEDWRSPLVARLTAGASYADGNATVIDSFKASGSTEESNDSVSLSWSGLGVDYSRCLNTYQESVITEFAALAVACILVHTRARLEITEVTRRGEKVDYWLGKRELLLEVSGTQAGDLAAIRDRKADEQLRVNPFGIGGYVCVSRFDDLSAVLWFYIHFEAA